MCVKKLLILITLFLFNTSITLAQEKVEEDSVSDMPEINLEYDKIVAVPNGPTYIKNLSRKMKSPGYWISKLQNPDEIILSSEQITKHNQEIYNKPLWVTNILNYPKVIRKASFQRQINRTFRLFLREPYLNSSLKIIPRKEINDLKNNAKPSVAGNYLRIKYALTTNYTDVRLLPSNESFLYNKETFDIDRSQVAGLDIGEPIIVISQTRDKKWNYIVSCVAEGWIKADDCAYTDYNTISKWINKKNFIVVTETKTDLFLDEQMCEYHDYVRMGATFPLIKECNETYCVDFPKANKQNKLFFDKAYILKANANKGYLPYTQRNILNIAFQHLNSPYSWGGQDGEQDCSTFIRQIFSCFGLLLPRNSSSQIRCGVHPVRIDVKDPIEVKSKKIIDNAVEAISLLTLPGHIMLYIGNENNTPYVIHAIWGTENYTEERTKSISFINKIIVSDLFIGKDTSKGSLLERLNNLTILKD